MNKTKRTRRNRISFNLASLTIGLQKSVVFLFTVFAINAATANPVLQNVASGNVTVSQSGNTTTVKQSSQNAIINWQSFNIAAGQKTQFVQPNVNSLALNRISPSLGASQIYGVLTSNGKIILINAAGIHFGPGSVVDVGSIIASTSDISNANFLAGKLIFDQPSLYSGSSIVNQGTIIASNYGLVALLGDNVTNSGMIQAQLGSIALGSGSEFTLNFDGDQLVNFAVNAPGDNSAGIKNTGAIIANGGTILVTANTAAGVLDDAIDMQGVTVAKSVSQHGGDIVFSATNGTVNVGGKVIATGHGSNSTGGTVEILGQNVNIGRTAVINASGTAGGGNIYIGGNEHGAGPLQDALNTTVAAGSLINASAITSGNGGNVIVWSNDTTQFAGTILAEGGSSSGNGGFSEVSGHQLLDFTGSVNLLAPNGATGTLLLDPENLIIQDSGSTTATATNSGYASNSDNSILTVADLESELQDSDVLVQTSGSGNPAIAGDITVADPITWSTTTTLTLSAYHSINIDANITNVDAGSLTLRADNTGTGQGTITFGGGVITMAGGGTLTLYYNPIEQGANFGTPDAAISDPYNDPNTTNFNLDFITTFMPFMLVNNVTNLQNINNNLYGNYALSTNIDASVTSTWNSGAGFIPIGLNSGTGFNGTFDGLGNTISNLYTTSTGLFDSLISGATIQNVNLSNSTTVLTNVGSGSYGLLVGTNYGNIINSSANGTITNTDSGGSEVFGGLVGDNQGSIVSSSSSGMVTNIDMAGGFEVFGGLVGTNENYISNSSSSATVANESSAGMQVFGGLVGLSAGSDADYLDADIESSVTTGVVQNIDQGMGNEVFGGFVGEVSQSLSGSFNSIINQSTSSATVSNQDSGGMEIFGGFVGQNLQCNIFNSTNSGSVSNMDTGGGFEVFGGFVGNNNGSLSNDISAATVSNQDVGGYENFGGFVGNNNGTTLYDTSLGNVTNTDNGGNEFFAAMVGNNNGTISNSSAAGNVTNTESGVGQEYFGGLVGDNSGSIFSSYTTGTITNYDTGGNEFFGGLTGANTFGSIFTSYSFATVTTNDTTGTEDIGGLAGFNNFGYIQQSYSVGTVFGLSPLQLVGGLIGDNNGDLNQVYSAGRVNVQASYVGGLVGKNEEFQSIMDSYSSEIVTSSGDVVGGLVGQNYGSISESYSTGSVSSTGNTVGGLVGQNEGTGTILNTYSISSVSGNNIVGGLVGENDGSITNSYSAGAVSGSSSLGGFVGTNTGLIQGAFFDAVSSGQLNSGSASGVTAGCFSGGCTDASADLSDVNTYLYASGTNNTVPLASQWDITDVPSTTDTAPPNIWYISEGSTRPLLTMEFSTVITNAHQLQLAASAPNASYTLANNIDLSVMANPADIWGGTTGNGFDPIGTSTNPFTGTFDGNGLTISNYSSSVNGLFGVIGTNGSATGSVQNLIMTNASVIVTSGDDTGYGILAGTNSGVVYGDIVSGSINASMQDVGGLVGLNQSGGVVSNSGSSGSVNGSLDVGGLVGANSGAVVSSYSSANVSGADAVGGLIGDAGVGSVQSIVSSVGDVSGVTNVGGLIGLFEAGSMNEAFSSGSVSGTADVGGLVGLLVKGGSPLSITDSYSFSAVSGDMNVGGLVGYADGDASLTNVYSTGLVTGTANVGGLIGESAGAAIMNAYYDMNTSGLSVGVGNGSQANVMGETTAEMLLPSTFCGSGTCSGGGSLGYDITPTTGVWSFVMNGTTSISYPYLTIFYPVAPTIISGNSNAGSNQSVNLEVNGSVVSSADSATGGTISSGSTTTGADGSYYFIESSGVVPAVNNSNNPSLVVTTLASGVGAAVSDMPASGVGMTGLNITVGDLSLGNASTQTLSNSFLSANQADPILSTLYTNSGNNISFASGVGLTATSTTTLMMIGNISANSVNLLGALDVAANVMLSSSGNVTLAGGVSGANESLTVKDTSAQGNNSVTLDGSVVVDDLIIDGSNNSDTVDMNNNNGSITWNVSGTDAGSFSSSSVAGTFNNVSTVDGSNSGDTFDVSGSIGSLVGGTGTNLLVATNTSGADVWNIMGTNSGTMSGGATVGSFSGMSSLVGSGHGDTFNVDNGGSLSGSISATNGTLSYSTYSSPVTITLPEASAPAIAGGVSGITTFVGGLSTNVFNDTATGSVWNVTGSNSGNVAGVNFTNFANLNGGSNNSFLMDQNGSIGSVSGTTSTLSYANYTGAVNVNVVTDTGTNVGGFSGITALTGNGSSSTLTDTSTGTTWNVTANDAGNVAGVAFTSMANLAGGSNNIFMMDPNGVIASVSGTTSTLSYANDTGTVNVNLVSDSGTNVGGFSGITTLTGNGNSSTLTDTSTGTTWNVTANDAGNVAGVAFTNMAKLAGGSNNIFMMDPNGVIASVSGTTSTLSYANDTGAVNVNVVTDTGTNVSGFSGITTLIGNGSSSTVTDTTAGTTWNVTANDAGNVAGVAFTSMANLAGGSNNIFMMGQSGVIASVSGTTSTLSYANYSGAVNVNLATDTGTNVSGFSGITTLTGNGSSSTLTDTSTGTTWNVTGNDAGNVAGVAFTSMANLAGGSNNIFMMDPNGVIASVSGTTSTLSYANDTGTVNVNLVSDSGTNVSGFSGITTVAGNGSSSTLTDTQGSNTWNITGNNAGTVASDAFSGFANLTGGSGDTFSLGDGFGVSGAIAATAGTLSYSAYTTAVTVNLATDTSTNVGGFSGITNVVGNSNSGSTLDGANTANTFEINGANSGNVNGTVTYSGMPNLVGGTGNNTFQFYTGGSEATVNGGVNPTATLDYSQLGAVTVNISLTGAGTYHGFAGTSTLGLTGSFNNIDNLLGTTSTANTLTGTNSNTTWTITGVNTGTSAVSSNTLAFSNFPNLAAGSGTNTINYNSGGSITGTITGISTSSNPGNLIYNAPLTFTSNLTISTTGTASIIFNGGVSWSGAYTLTIDSANDITINSPITGLKGSLVLSAANKPESITTNASGAINVKNFDLVSGQWYQVSSTLPAFNVTGNFQINGGVMPAPDAQFIRAVAGNGTASSPYQLVDIYGVEGMGSSLATLGYDYQVDNNISGSITSNWNSGVGFVPVGNNGTPFTGSINGQNYSITNVDEVRITDAIEDNAVGLFGVTSGGTISNLSVSGSFEGETNVGALVGTANNTTVTNSSVLGNTTVTLYNDGDTDLANAGVGGLIGEEVKGSITNSSSAATVVDQMFLTEAGGLVGYNDGGTITGSTNTGSVENGVSNSYYSYGQCGFGFGFFGYFGFNGSNKFFNGFFTGDSNAVGGLVGYNGNGGIISSSTNTGTVNDVNDTYGSAVGGLVGVNGSGSTISNSHSTGSVLGGNSNSMGDVGGLAGANAGTVTGSYSTGAVSAGNNNTSGNVGGLIANNSGTITNSYNTGSITVGTSSFDVITGGLVGYAAKTSNITGSYDTGSISIGSSSNLDITGGVLGENYGIINNSTKNSGSVTIAGQNYNFCGFTSGSDVTNLLIGENYGTSSSVSSTGKVSTSSTAASSPLLTLSSLLNLIYY